MSVHAPIAAIATAPGRGGIGVVRVSGADLSELVRRLFQRELTPRHAHYLPFKAVDGELLDEGIALYFKGPHSYTGEDVLELQGHGGPRGAAARARQLPGGGPRPRAAAGRTG